MSAKPTATTTAKGIPASIWVLGFVSLLMDLSSEMIHALLPVFLVTVLGASFFEVGWIEGIEINLFSFVAGLDLRQPAIKLPGFGQIDIQPRSAIGGPNTSKVRLSTTTSSGFQSFY